MIAASIVSFIINYFTEEDKSTFWIEPLAILIAVIVCSMVAAVNDWQKEKQFQALNATADDSKKVMAIRDGKPVELKYAQILVGDVIKIFEGMGIPCDGYVIQSNELSSDESAMTGETDPIKKGNLQACIIKRNELKESGEANLQSPHAVPSPVLLSGTKVMQGEGYFVVVVVGKDCAIGKIRAKISTDEASATPLQKKLETISEDIGKFGLYAAIATVLVLSAIFIVNSIFRSDEDFQLSSLTALLDFFIIGVTIVVVAIPEGLPLAVTLSLAFSVKQMLKQNNLVR